MIFAFVRIMLIKHCPFISFIKIWHHLVFLELQCLFAAKSFLSNGDFLEKCTGPLSTEVKKNTHIYLVVDIKRSMN